jgi:hypothetical protein
MAGEHRRSGGDGGWRCRRSPGDARGSGEGFASVRSANAPSRLDEARGLVGPWPA